MPEPTDPFLKPFVLLARRADKAIRKLLVRMLYAPYGTKEKLYQRILHLLANVKKAASRWAHNVFGKKMRESDAIAKSILDSAKPWGPAQDSALRLGVDDMVQHLEGALASVRMLTTRLLRATKLGDLFNATIRTILERARRSGLGQSQVRKLIGNALSKQWETGIVSIVTRSGKIRRFTLDYYAGMVAHGGMHRSRSLGILTRCIQEGHDLVSISPQPSTIGDWCDNYRGKTYSISGMSQKYPALSEAPNGGPPLHPWCQHFLEVA